MKTSLFLLLLIGLPACGGSDTDNESTTDDVKTADNESETPAAAPGAAGTFPKDSPQAQCSDTPVSDGECDAEDVCASLDPDCENTSPFPPDPGGGAAGTFPKDSPLAGCSDTPMKDGECDPDDVCASLDPDCDGNSLPPNEGPEPVPDEECDGEIVDTEADCLQDDAYCTELPSGNYCTGAAEPMCPKHFEPADGCPDRDVYWCFSYSESLDCKLAELSAEECTEAGGEVVGDPGDGSISARGCPDDGTELGFVVPGGIEGALCCAK